MSRTAWRTSSAIGASARACSSTAPVQVRAVDIHTHFVPKTWPDYQKTFGGEDWPWLRHNGSLPGGTYGYRRGCGAMLMVGDTDFRPVTAALWDVQERVQDLNDMGLAQQVISQTPLLFQWHRDPETTSAVARDLNDLALEMVKDPGAEGRLHALCQVPLQCVDRACSEISRAKKTGHVGVQIGNHVGRLDLDDDALVAFLKHCAYEDFPVLVHPWDMSDMGPGSRAKDFMMGWTVGMPMETHLSITRMILGGAFDKLPESLKICFAHGGGAFPALLGRLDNAWRERSIARGKAQRPPREYMGRFHLDSIVFDPLMLQMLVNTVGEDKVMLGSDYPFPLGEQEIGSVVTEATTLSDEQRDRILFGNAELFFNLKPRSVMVQRRKRPKSPVISSNFMQEGAGQVGRGFCTLASGQRHSVHTHSRVHNIINGELIWSGNSIDLINPATGEKVGEVVNSTAHDVDAAVSAATAAMADGSEWRRMSLEQRCAAVARLAALVEESSEELARLESRDTGKPFALAKGLDIARSAWNLRFFSNLAAHSAGDIRRSEGPLESISYSLRKPVGVVGIVTPWNLPLYLFTWKLAPALVMGNSVVAKPSEFTPSTATRIVEMCARSGIPRGVVNIVHGQGHVVGKALVSHPDVSAVSFTGGTATGAIVASLAAPQFKKLSLELGGKNAAVIFDDCSFDDAVVGVVRSSFLNSGQICLCSSRILVQRGKDGAFYERFVAALVAATKQLVVGDPNDPFTDLGPLSSEAHFNKVQSAVKAAQGEGGKVLCGGSIARVPGNGYYFEPTIVAGLSITSTTAQNEIFGPVITVHPFDDESEAVKFANCTRYGLSASVWTESLARSEVAEKLHAGTVWVNTWLNRELHMPFGGVKDSGVNREGGTHSLDFYSEPVTICVKRGSRASLPMPSGRRPEVATGVRGFCTFSPRDAPKPLGHYVHARRCGDLVFLAGIGPRIPESDQVPGGPVTDPTTGERSNYDVTAQSLQCFANVRHILKSVGCTMEDIVDVQVYLIDMKRDFAAFNAVWAEEMAGMSATRTTIAINDLPPGGRIAVEMKVVAQHPSSRKPT